MKKVLFLLLPCLILAFGGCAQGGDDDDDDDSTYLSGTYKGRIWDTLETGSGYVKVDFVQKGTSLTGKMYVDNNGDGNYQGSGDRQIGISATVSGTEISMNIAGGGIDFMSQSTYAGTAKATDNLIIDCSFAATGHAGDDAYSGKFNVYRVGTAVVRGTVAASAFDLTGSESDLEIYLMYDLGQEGTMNFISFDPADMTANQNFDFEFNDVTNGKFYLAVIVDSFDDPNTAEDDGTPEYFGIYGAGSAAESADAYNAWVSKSLDIGTVPTLEAKAGTPLDLGTIYLANVSE